MRLLALHTPGYYAFVPDHKYDRAREYIWYLLRQGRRMYAIRAIKTPDGKWTTQRLHRFIMSLDDPSILDNPSIQIDHIDHNGLNCMDDNLRRATSRQNQHNRRKSAGTTSAYKGVHWDTEKNKWRARIRGLDGKKIHLGIFTNELDAALAYYNASVRLQGEFAVPFKLLEKHEQSFRPLGISSQTISAAAYA
jgi:AP2 domain